jgi:secondary thiamine-phosphate synthase enzyme
MMIQQVKIELKSRPRGCHLVTREITEQLPKPLPEAGLLNLFVQHTSCALSINENADPDVRTDLAKIMDRLVKENEPYYNHTLEGADDMPAHAKCSMFGVSLTIPITQGRLNLGMWQGIYLCEFRDYGGARKVIATIYS